MFFFFYFYFLYYQFKKTAMHTLFVNKTAGNTCKNNTIDRRLSFLMVILQTSQKCTKIFDLPPKHNWCFQHLQIKKSYRIWFFSGVCVEKKKARRRPGAIVQNNSNRPEQAVRAVHHWLSFEAASRRKFGVMHKMWCVGATGYVLAFFFFN